MVSWADTTGENRWASNFTASNWLYARSGRSLAPSRLVRFTTQDMDLLYRHDLRSYAIVILNLARELSRRLRVADGILADLIANVLNSYLVQKGAGGG